MTLLEYIKSKNNIRKIILAGSGAVGKTSLLKVLKDNKPLKACDDSLEYHRTLFLECEQIESKQYEGLFQVYDIAGQLELPIHTIRDTPRTVFGEVDLIILVFANNNVKSLLDMQKWVTLIRDFYVLNNIKVPPFALINNKIDLKRNFDTGLIRQIETHENIIEYFEISCLDGQGIEILKKWLDSFFFSNQI